MKSHLNIQSILKKITAFQSEEAYCIKVGITFSNFCDVQTNFVEHFVGNILTVFSRGFFLFYCQF